MIDEAFIRYRGASCRVMRLRLAPLTIGHLFVLAEIGHDMTWTRPVDLVLSCLVCACKNERDARSTLASMWLPLFVRIWAWICRGLNHDEQVRLWEEYIDSNLTVPETEQPPNDQCRQLRSPEHWRLASMLLSDFHMSWPEAMDMPVATARALWAVEGDRRGTLILTDPGYRDRAHALKEAVMGNRN